MSEPIYTIRIDIQHPRRKFNATVHAADTPVVRAYLYQNGKQWVPPSGWTATLGFDTNSDFEDATSLVEVTGTIGTETPLNYFDFDFSSGDIADSGDYFCQILINNAVGDNPIVFGDGTLHVLPSPISGEYTSTTLTSVVNWSTITSIGTTPWPDSTTVEVANCAATPITISLDDAGKTFLMNDSCSSDCTFNLPDATNSSSIGSIYKFANLTDKVLRVRAGANDHIDIETDGNAIYSGVGGINTNPPYSYIRIKQIEENSYLCISGRLRWTYTT